MAKQTRLDTGLRSAEGRRGSFRLIYGIFLVHVWETRHGTKAGMSSEMEIEYSGLGRYVASLGPIVGFQEAQRAQLGHPNKRVRDVVCPRKTIIFVTTKF